MNIKEILENYQAYYMQYRYGDATPRIADVFAKLDQMFWDEKLIDYEGGGIRIVELFYCYNKTAEQIAEMYGIDPRTVYRRRNKALIRLSEVFDR